MFTRPSFSITISRILCVVHSEPPQSLTTIADLSPRRPLFLSQHPVENGYVHLPKSPAYSTPKFDAPRIKRLHVLITEWAIRVDPFRPLVQQRDYLDAHLI